MRFSATIIALAFTMTSSAGISADMPAHHHVSALSPRLDALATQMAHYRAVAVACRPTDGTVMNRDFWRPYLASVPVAQRSLFISTVKYRSQPELAALSGPDHALACDDALDRVEDKFPAISGPFGAGPAAEPLCWSDVTDTNRCDGVGDDDILSGLPALVNGY